MISARRPNRRSILVASVTALIAAPYVWTPRARAAQQIMVRTPGGVFDDVKRATVYEPFREATGIEIVPVAATAAKMLAMYKAGQAEIDAIDTDNDVLLELENNGVLIPLDYKSF